MRMNAESKPYDLDAEGILQPLCAQKLHSQLLQDVAADALQLVELGADVEREYGQVLGTCYQQTPPSASTLDALHLASARVAGRGACGHRQADARRGQAAWLSLCPV